MTTSSLNNKGITMVELLAVVMVVTLLITGIIFLINPLEILMKGRDEKRLSDLAVLSRAVEEYMLDNATYPDLAGTTRFSTDLPSGNAGPLENPADGWINVNLSAYLTRLPTDPINDETYRYVYSHTTYTYELNATLEILTSHMVEDGGNDNNVYELGNDLTIL